MGVIPMGEHYKSIFLSVKVLADKFQFVEDTMNSQGVAQIKSSPLVS